MKKILAVLAIMAVICGACSQSPMTAGDSFRTLPEEGWAYGDTIVFTFSPQPADSAAKLALAVRHAAGYQFANLWLELSSGSGENRRIDTVNVRLADKYGRRLGRGIGVSYMKLDTLPGIYSLVCDSQIVVRHIMRLDTVVGIEQIGITHID